MTELITLLALKASGATTGWLDRQKFADLIVQECIDVLNKRFMGDLNREDMEVRRCIADVKKHFGVEESQTQPDQEAAAFIAAENKKVASRYGYVPKLHPSEWQDK